MFCTFTFFYSRYSSASLNCDLLVRNSRCYWSLRARIVVSNLALLPLLA